MKKGKETGELGQASTLAWLFFVSVLFLLQLALGIVSCSCQLHCENKETFRLAGNVGFFFVTRLAEPIRGCVRQRETNPTRSGSFPQRDHATQYRPNSLNSRYRKRCLRYGHSSHNRRRMPPFTSKIHPGLATSAAFLVQVDERSSNWKGNNPSLPMPHPSG